MKVSRVFSVEKDFEGWKLYRTEKDENGVWRNLPPIICTSKQAAQSSGRQWRMAIQPVRRNK
jgi:hypothetical protein